MPTFNQAFADSFSFIAFVAGFLLPFIITASVFCLAMLAYGWVARHIKQNRPHP